MMRAGSGNTQRSPGAGVPAWDATETTVLDEAEKEKMGTAILAKDVSLVMAGKRGSNEILRQISLTVSTGEYVGIVGPSGSGKTMFLNAVAGLERYTGGVLEVFGEAPRTGRRDMAYAMARDALLPWRTAVENVELSLEARGVPKRERRERALEGLGRVGLSDFANAYRAELSQGMRQRVALARSLVANPSLLLLDEPFAALDAQTRMLMQDRFLKLMESYKGTVFLVTHDLAEAILLSDRVIVFTRGPARVKKEFRVDFPRPRSSFELRSTLEFQEMQTRIWAELAEEVTG